MTLDERMEAINEEELVFIGSKSSYFFIGHKSEYEKCIDEISKTCLKEIVRLCNKAKKELDSVKSCPPKEDEVRKVSIYQQGKKVEVEKHYKELYKEWQSLVKEKEKRYELLNKRNETFLPLRERTVKEVYRKEVDGGIAILVKGFECGNYWCLEEWKKDH